jgi:hypothetical protein
VNPIERMLLRLDGADGVAATLTQAWDVFDLIRAVSRQNEQHSGDGAAYTMAAAAAVRGRNLLTMAPSIPRHPRASSRHLQSAVADPAAATGHPGASGPDDTADTLATLASLLASRLIASALAADDAADRRACTAAAAEAGSICSLLDGE